MGDGIAQGPPAAIAIAEESGESPLRLRNDRFVAEFAECPDQAAARRVSSCPDRPERSVPSRAVNTVPIWRVISARSRGSARVDPRRRRTCCAQPDLDTGELATKRSLRRRSGDSQDSSAIRNRCGALRDSVTHVVGITAIARPMTRCWRGTQELP